MLEKGFETPGIVQLAGEDLDMAPGAYSELLDTIFRELDLVVQPEVAYCAYAASIAEELSPWAYGGPHPQPERIEEWLRSYFENFLAANAKYRSGII